MADCSVRLFSGSSCPVQGIGRSPLHFCCCVLHCVSSQCFPRRYKAASCDHVHPDDALFCQRKPSVVSSRCLAQRPRPFVSFTQPNGQCLGYGFVNTLSHPSPFGRPDQQFQLPKSDKISSTYNMSSRTFHPQINFVS